MFILVTMKNAIMSSLVFCLLACNTSGQSEDLKSKKVMSDKKEKTEDEWRELLNPEQFSVLREKGTEAPFSGKYYLHKEKGIYVCAACGNDLFKSDTKFDSGCGWPSFSDVIDPSKVEYTKDKSHGMIRTEITCKKCGGHLGHVFDDGPSSTGLRFCINSVSIDFKE